MASSKSLAIRIATVAALVAVACAKGYGGNSYGYAAYYQPQPQVYAQVIPGRVQYYTTGTGVGIGGPSGSGSLSGGGGLGGGYGLNAGFGGVNNLSGAIGQSGGLLISLLIIRK